MLDIKKEDCTGCEMCKELCPIGAIEFEIKNGFRFPVVDEEKCIKCNLCNKRCPAMNDSIEKNEFPSVYAAWTKDTVQRRKCTSGGICYELSKYVLSKKGYVAGVAWKDGFKSAEYILIDKLEDLPLITQTKYFQPEMNGIFAKIKAKLDDGHTVLFIGSSCSNAGLKSYLNKNYDNLLCCDFICRGYTTQIYHQKRVEDLEKKFKSKVIGVYYKDKRNGWEQFGTRFEFENGKSYYINRYKDPYEYMLQIDDYVTRTSCFECKYRECERITDLTVGDFWAIKDVTDDDRKNGVSVVLVHTDKGKQFFDNINEQIEREERSAWEIAKGNMCLTEQLPFKLGREEFYDDLEKLSIDQVHHKYGNVKKFDVITKLKKIKHYLGILLRLDLISFIYYNFFCKKVERSKGKYIFTCRGTRLNLEKGSKVIVNGQFFVNDYKHKHSNEQTYIHVYPRGRIEINGTVRIFANSSVDVLEDGLLSIGQMNSNYNMTIVCANEIRIGIDVELGRNVILYDSNFHKTGLSKSIKGRALDIKNHVWLCTGVCVAKGLTINEGAICGINSTITKNVKSRTMVLGNPAKTMMENVKW